MSFLVKKLIEGMVQTLLHYYTTPDQQETNLPPSQPRKRFFPHNNGPKGKENTR